MLWRMRVRTIRIMLLMGAAVGLVTATAQAQSDGPTPPPSTVHIVQRGETLFMIAQQYGVTPEAIVHANGISDPRQIYVGQPLVIPAGDGSGATPTAPYVVNAGDTLVGIARRHGASWQTLARINGLLSPTALYPGLVVQVPVENSLTRVREGGSAGTLYVVRPDDIPLRIALRYGTSRWVLAALNHLASPQRIYPGQELIVPGEGPGWMPAPFISIQIQPLPATQGATVMVAVHVTEPVTLEGTVFDGQFQQQARLPEENGVYYWLVGVEARMPPGMYEMTLTATDDEGYRTMVTTAIVVQAARFGYERIDLSADRADSLGARAVATEYERLYPLLPTFTPVRLWTTPFQRPCVGTVSAYFGTHRAYNDGPYTSYHSGIDFRAPAGTPVYASAAGTVLLAEPLAMYGNMVVIDHGWGLLTGYGHLASIEVQVGQQVRAGDVIGRVGNTGVSTGAHLHWEVWVGGVSVDGLQWLDETSLWPVAQWLGIGG